MEHGRFDYSPISERPVTRLPNGARVAVWITPNVEHYHWNKPAIALTQMTTSLKPDVLNYAWRDYGAAGRHLAHDGDHGAARLRCHRRA